MQQVRPTAVLVIAIFHFLIGGMGLMCNLCNMANQMVAAGGSATFGMNADPKQAQMQRGIEKAMEKAAPLAKTVEAGNTAASLCFAGLLVVAGFGLLRMASWGRSLSLAYGILALTVKVGVALYTILVLVPAMEPAMEPVKAMVIAEAKTPVDPQFFRFMLIGMKVSTFVTVLFPLIYPFIILIVMNTTGVKNAFRLAAESSLDSDAEGLASNEPFQPGADDRFTR